MIRNIKIRAWDKEENEMVWDGVDYELRLLRFPTLDDIDCNIGFMKKSDGRLFEVMQGIGRTDLNSKDIYEGDIVQGMDEALYLVRYSNHKAAFVLFTIGGKGELYFSEHENPMEIIGNQFETPDLMKVIQATTPNPHTP